ncbi:MAG: hypothetical protein JO219_11875 [Candidatus Eremiobacteraeota bacterium]|nr:hypothetical protein [Candidatus Eremiobacteraeota bacterium]MBV8365491.1 hypothetical protein [Candidatus Eremiobacteraeota bacterium]
MVKRFRDAALLVLLAAAIFAGFVSSAIGIAAAAPPSPSPTPTPVPTPFMELALIPNGTWQVIIEDKDIQYSKMTLKTDGNSISGTWSPDKKTTYLLSGLRDGAHLKLDIKSSDATDATVIGKVDATLDGIADMFGTITLNGVEKPFQGAQHSRVPPPVDASPQPGQQPQPGAPNGGGYPGQPGQPGYPH